jgi:PIN domain nuclease of toxin-antitoxin system
MRLLLDTHALIWWILDDPHLSRRARQALIDLDNTIYVSASSAWEIATKYRIGKLPQAEPFVQAFSESMRKQGFRELSISMDHANRAGLLAGQHQDPFDRILIAQSQAENLLLVSNEKLFDKYGVQRLW